MSDKILPETDATPATCEWCHRYVTRHMDAYYYGFTATGVRDVDNVLCSVASAGKGCHYTEDWGDHGYPEQIQKAADKAAEASRAKDALIAELAAALERVSKWCHIGHGGFPIAHCGVCKSILAALAKAKEAGR